MANIVVNVIENLDIKKFFTLITDNASNMKAS